MELKFRLLKADEIDCRIATVSEKGLSLLLYKNARIDMNLLDEVCGPMNWQRAHSRDNANCIVSIWDDEKKMWVSKEDVGTESNAEAQKGLASDSFKRACFNWGIGRELYTAPFIWIPADKCKISYKNNRWSSNDRFNVREIAYDDERRITRLVIENGSNEVVYRYGHKSREDTVSNEHSKEPIVQGDDKLSDIDPKYLKSLTDEMNRKFVTEQQIFNRYNIKALGDLTFAEYQSCMKSLEKTKPPINPPEAKEDDLPWNQTPQEAMKGSRKKTKKEQASELYDELLQKEKFT